jgi:putative flippase GtrA
VVATGTVTPVTAHLRGWATSRDGRKILRFVMTSVVSTLFSESVILVVYGFSLTHSPMWATAIGNIAAMPPAYYLTRQWAWGKSGSSRWRSEVLPFVALNLAGLSVSLVGATYCRHFVYSHHLTHLVNTVLVAGVNLVSFAVFWVLKIILFNRIFRTPLD